MMRSFGKSLTLAWRELRVSGSMGFSFIDVELMLFLAALGSFLSLMFGQHRIVFLLMLGFGDISAFHGIVLLQIRQFIG